MLRVKLVWLLEAVKQRMYSYTLWWFEALHGCTRAREQPCRFGVVVRVVVSRFSFFYRTNGAAPRTSSRLSTSELRPAWWCLTLA